MSFTTETQKSKIPSVRRHRRIRRSFDSRDARSDVCPFVVSKKKYRRFGFVNFVNFVGGANILVNILDGKISFSTEIDIARPRVFRYGSCAAMWP